MGIAQLLLPVSKSHTLHPVVNIAKWISHQSILLYRKRIYPLLWESKMPNAGPTETSKKGEHTEYFIVNV